MGGGESKNSQLLRHGGLLSEAERETLRAVFSNIAGDSEASTISSQQFKVICDRACENQPCERKLHLVIFSAISSVLNVLSHFRKFQKKAH